MAVLRESPWYQEILSEGIERGIERGIEQGLEQGLEEGIEQGEAQMLLQVLRHRFGELDIDLVNAIRRLSTPQLEALVAVVLNASALPEVAARVAELAVDRAIGDAPPPHPAA